MTQLPRLVVLVSGRGTNLEAIVHAMQNGRIQARIAAVITDNPQARALHLADKYGLPTVVLNYKNYGDRNDYNAALLEQLLSLAPDLVVLSGYMRLLPVHIVQRFAGKIVNIHPSLLPSFPGLYPHRQALAYGVKISGCTVHFVDEGVDTGPIIMQQAVTVRDDDTEETLAARILAEEHRVYPEAIRYVLTGRTHVDGRRVVVADERKEDIDAR